MAYAAFGTRLLSNPWSWMYILVGSSGGIAGACRARGLKRGAALAATWGLLALAFFYFAEASESGRMAAVGLMAVTAVMGGITVFAFPPDQS